MKPQSRPDTGTRRRWAGLLALVVAGVAAGIGAGASAQTRHPAPPPVTADAAWAPAIADGRAAMRAFLAADQAPGASIAVAIKGRIVWAEGFGFADVERRRPVDVDTEFRIGSISKAFTSSALGQLVEAGRLDLDAPVQRYVPAFPRKQWDITTRQLASHTAGIRHYRADPKAEMYNSRHYDTVDAGLALFADDALLFEPGTRFAYSSYGWNLVSAVIEGASHQGYLAYMKEHVVRPLGLVHTRPDEAHAENRARTQFYEHDAEHHVVVAPFVDNSYKWAGGGWLSTPSDLVRYASALLAGKLVRPATRALLFTEQKTRDGKPTKYGLGWHTEVNAKGGRWVGHSGGSVGGLSQLMVFPDSGLVVAATSNLGDGKGPTDTVEAIAERFLAAMPRAATAPTTPAATGH